MLRITLNEAPLTTQYEQGYRSHARLHTHTPLHELIPSFIVPTLESEAANKREGKAKVHCDWLLGWLQPRVNQWEGRKGVRSAVAGWRGLTDRWMAKMFAIF